MERIVAAVASSPRAVVLAAAFADEFAFDLDELAHALEYLENLLEWTRPPQKWHPPQTGRARIAALALQLGLNEVSAYVLNVDKEGYLQEAERYYQWSVAQFRVLHDLGTVTYAVTLLGVVAEMEERFDEAARYYQEALTNDEAAGEVFNVGVDLAAPGRVAMLAGHYDEAEQLSYQALALHRRARDWLNPPGTLKTPGKVAQARGRRGQALYYFCLSDLFKTWAQFLLWRTSRMRP